MRLGRPVPGVLNEALRFVEDDMHHIAERVREYDPEAALARESSTGRLALVRHVVLDVDPDLVEAPPHDTWLIAFWVRDPASGEYLTREPDGRIMEQLRGFDTWTKRYPARYRRVAERVIEARRRQQEELERERARELAEQYLFHGRKYAGIRQNIYVPADIPRGQG